MTANVNPVTGIAYGLLDARNVPYLYDDIITHGDDLTYKGFKEEARKNLEAVLEDFDADDVPAATADETRLELAAGMFRLGFKRRLDASDREAAALVDELIGLMCTESLTFDIQEAVDALMERLEQFEYFMCDDSPHEYSYAEKGAVYHLSGDAPPTIWVFKSPYVTYCRTCSPCAPGAGDLDSACAPESANNIAYCPPAEDWIHEDNEDRWPAGIWLLGADGRPGEQVWSPPVEKEEDGA